MARTTVSWCWEQIPAKDTDCCGLSGSRPRSPVPGPLAEAGERGGGGLAALGGPCPAGLSSITDKGARLGFNM